MSDPVHRWTGDMWRPPGMGACYRPTCSCGWISTTPGVGYGYAISFEEDYERHLAEVGQASGPKGPTPGPAPDPGLIHPPGAPGRTYWQQDSDPLGPGPEGEATLRRWAEDERAVAQFGRMRAEREGATVTAVVQECLRRYGQEEE